MVGSRVTLLIPSSLVCLAPEGATINNTAGMLFGLNFDGLISVVDECPPHSPLHLGPGSLDGTVMTPLLVEPICALTENRGSRE